MTSRPLEHERLACSPMGCLEYVIESQQEDGRVEKWFVLRPNEDLAMKYLEKGVSIARGCRVVVDAESLRPLAVLPGDVQPPTPSAAGFNPYFELPPS